MTQDKSRTTPEFTVDSVLAEWRAGTITDQEAMGMLRGHGLFAEAFMRMAHAVLDIKNR